jgi:hypothetical protein
VDSISELVSVCAQFNQGWRRAALAITSQSDIRASGVIVAASLFARGIAG